MTRSMNLLTDSHIQDALPKDKMYTLTDGGSLFLEVFPTGSKYWRFGFRFPKGDKTKRKLSLGVYPKVTLKTARELAQEARQQLAAGIDPRIQRRAKADITFETFASEWMDRVSECSRDPEREYAQRLETAREILREWKEEKYPPAVVVNNWRRCMDLLLFLLSPPEPGIRGQRQEPALKKISPP